MSCSFLCCCRRKKDGHSRQELSDLSEAENAATQRSRSPLNTITIALPYSSGSKVEQQRQMPTLPKSLPSRVEETLEECPKFRIVLIGKSGVGKSSLIQSVFNVALDQIDIAHDRAGEAKIDHEYTSMQNPRFILHDSKGFEPGTTGTWETVQNFINSRQDKKLPEKIHAIWLCIETPRIGKRLLQTADENLLKLAKKFDIPIITVFTKYDRLVAQFLKDDKSSKSNNEKIDIANRDALKSLDGSVKELQEVYGADRSIPCAKMSMTGSDNKSHNKEMLTNLIKVTRERLSNVEGELQLLWDAAQQVDAGRKVDFSISEGFKKYWLDLGQSSAFEGQMLIDCIYRIHEDVLKVWNFNDPTGILSGTNFFTEMIRFVKPLLENQADNTSFSSEQVPAFGAAGAKVLVPLLQKLGLSNPVIYYLHDTYQKFTSTAKLLATYTINLVLVMHNIFTTASPSDPPRVLSTNLVSSVLKRHKTYLEKEPLDNIDSAREFTRKPEEVIAAVIRKRLSQNSKGLVSGVGYS